MSVSRPARLALWILLLSGSAAVGAYIAAHSNPLPPQVEGGSPSPTPSASPRAKPDRWSGTMRTLSYHQLYVGGRCISNWKTTLAFRVRLDGTVTGSGRARLGSKGPPCPFSVAQLQIGVFDLEVGGELARGVLRLRLTEVGHTPSAGADDLGGFLRTVLAPGEGSVLSVPVRGSVAEKTITLRTAGTDRDTFVSTNRIRLRCRSC